MRAAERAWLTLAAGVLGYEVAAGEGELLSDAADRWMLSHPWVTRTAIASIALHLSNTIPERFDPLHWLFTAKHHLQHR